MYLKTHISGEAIVYDSKGGKKSSIGSQKGGRVQGSLYNQQKRKIADACEYLRLSLKGNTAGRVPLVFTLTTPGFTDLANSPKFVSSWFDNMRANYGLREYVWVREVTKKGYPHFHCVGDWFGADWFFSVDLRTRTNYITSISLAWSNLFSSDSPTSVWLGGYWYGKRIYHLRTQAQARYLCKYMGKQFEDPKCIAPKPLTVGFVPQAIKRESLGALQLVKPWQKVPLLPSLSLS